MLLARRGVRVALVDRSRFGADTTSTHALMRAGVLQLHRWGLLDRVRAAGTPPVHRATFSYQDAVVPITIKPSNGVDALYAPRRTVLDPILVNAASEAGADVRFGVTVTGLTRGRGGRPDGVTGTGADGRPFTIHARFVVGADGFRSTIARLVEAPVEHIGRHASAITYGYWTGADVDGYEWIFRPDAAAGADPDQRRPGVRVRQRHARADRTRRHRRHRVHRALLGARPRRTAASRPGARVALAPSAAIPASCASRGATVGRSSATPATSRTRSAPTG